MKTYAPGDAHFRLTLLEPAPHRSWKCLCECGAIRIVKTDNFKSTKSCGCWTRDRVRTMNTTHGLSHLPEYGVWHMMKDRCLNPHAKMFNYYGGRGVTICDRWIDSFGDFYADMGPRPSRAHSLERLDNSQGYTPDNCQWTTSRVQARNRRSTRLLTAFGKTQCLTDWALEYGLNMATLWRRLRQGVPIENALTIPLNHCADLKHAKTTS